MMADASSNVQGNESMNLIMDDSTSIHEYVLVEDSSRSPPPRAGSSAGKTKGRRSSSRRSNTTKNNSSHSTSSSRTTTDRPVVDHSYMDHYHDPVATTFVGGQPKKSNSRGGVTTPFPEKLHSMLSHSGLEDVVGWQQHGRAFLIHEKDVFVKEIMPKFFNQSKLTSFQRQLNLYGFVRLTAQGRDRGAYYHPRFLRGRPDLCRLMQRTRIKGNGMKAAASPHTEPNFFAMEHCHDNNNNNKDVSSSNNDSMKQEVEGEEIPSSDKVMEDGIEGEDNRIQSNEDAFAEDDACSTEHIPSSVVTPSSSPQGRYRFSVSQNEFMLPFLESRLDEPLIPSSIVSPKFECGSATKALSLTSLLSPPPLMPSSALEEWGFTRDDDNITACLNLGMNDQEDNELLSMACDNLMPTVSDSSMTLSSMLVSPLHDEEQQHHHGDADLVYGGGQRAAV